ncbi:Sin3 complex subunit Stb2 [Geosmithia morbida]|uniref:Sin3 complex subunit Stb2 n=1 Tax=Geosmithia morbida TaxID=1094350 RepID=A0A9P4YZR4_9HYPO|nr:Sin3 complex subunit Stb2 [Geosmithia morbida]KAF4125050.1 Sin3 complex subunit Stb2 [Geosmithia morbida]
MSFSMPLPLPTVSDRSGPYHRHSDSQNSISKPSATTMQRTLRGSASADSGTITDPASQTAPAHGPSVPRKNIVFPDPVAFRYLEEDPCVTVVERRGSLRGYELYLVEQWACSRESPTLVIVAYTGDEAHSVIAGVLSVPVDEELWSARLRVYFRASRKYLARPKQTDLGELMVTNLSSFPSALTVIPVPDGDIRKHREIFVVNENLKRMGCAGRAGLTLTEPTEGTRTKFLSVYKVSDRIPFLAAVVELVKLCQVALYLFEKIEPEYIDGLLCDVTEKAIGNWWTEVGAEHYNFESNDGILGPTTVAALLGMLMGARNRLYWCGAPVGKDVFDVENTKRGIAYFQKLSKLEKTRRLDRPTLLKLHLTTAKAAAGDGWGVPKAVKSRMTEIGGKRGEIVMGMVSGKDKGGLADVETLDIDTFISFAYGGRAKWLWFGKPRPTTTDSSNQDIDRANPSFGADEDRLQPISRIRTQQPDDEPEAKRRDELLAPYSDAGAPGPATGATDSSLSRDPSRRKVLKNVAGKMSDARSGLGRIKDAVGGTRRGHGSRLSVSARDDMPEQRDSPGQFQSQGQSQVGVSSSIQDSAFSSTSALNGPNRAFTWKNKPEEYVAGRRRSEHQESSSHILSDDSQYPSSSAATSTKLRQQQEHQQHELDAKLRQISSDSDARRDVGPSTAASSIYGGNDAEGGAPPLSAEPRGGEGEMPGNLSRRHSMEVAQLSLKHAFNEDRWSRRMSFGDAEEAVLTWDDVVDIEELTSTSGSASGGGGVNLGGVLAMAEYARQLNQSIDDITTNLEPWVEEKMRAVALLDSRFAREKEDLQLLYHRLDEACQRVRFNSEEILANERSSLTESAKDIEVLVARLDYEIDALVQKVADVEDAIHNFERQVDELERSAAELKVLLETESWPLWLVRMLTGVGIGPNITQGNS